MVKISIPLLFIASSFLGGAEAAGNEEEVYKNVGVTDQQTANRTSYQCTFRNLWSKERQPKNFPKELARWASPILWTHTLQFEPWRAGDIVTRGVEKLAEVSDDHCSSLCLSGGFLRFLHLCCSGTILYVGAVFPGLTGGCCSLA